MPGDRLVLTRGAWPWLVGGTVLLGAQSIELGNKMVELERQAYEIAGEEFNLGSPKQLGAILYEKLGLPVLKKTGKGQASTAEEVLAKL
eukprot:gene1083-1439_t